MRFLPSQHSEYSYPQSPEIVPPILVTLVKIQPPYSRSNRQNVTPSSAQHIPLSLLLGGTSPWVSKTRQMLRKLSIENK